MFCSLFEYLQLGLLIRLVYRSPTISPPYEVVQYESELHTHRSHQSHSVKLEVLLGKACFKTRVDLEEGFPSGEPHP